ncbi:MAG: tetratricopeptide repeat protein [Polyangiaceae bacterium]|nr:tetratricopeptide repeat protein [Polyangiaceae bacterium]
MLRRTSSGTDPRDAQHWDDVDEASELLGERRFQDALTELKRVIEHDANNPYAYNLLGTALWELQQMEPARDAFKAAVLISPNFLAARLGLSHTLRKLGDLRGAEQQARVALSRFPDDGEAYHALGLALAAAGEKEEAVDALERFLASKPEFEAATEARGIIEMLREGEEDEGLDVDDD